METVLGKKGGQGLKLYGYRYDSHNKKFYEKEISVKESNTHNFRLPANNGITVASSFPQRKIGELSSVAGDYYAFYKKPSREDFITQVKTLMGQTTKTYEGLAVAERVKYMEFIGVVSKL
jgi:hypothetical protein